MMRLEIYIANQCTNCEEALLIAERARGIAGLEVAVIDLDTPGQNVPTRIVAVPTYLLNGRVVSLGNPRREEFLVLLRTELRRQIEEKAL
jgi:predicted thioredoxin/glutaredoxin